MHEAHTEMIDRPEAFERSRTTAKKMLSASKSAAPNPFNRARKRKKNALLRNPRA